MGYVVGQKAGCAWSMCGMEVVFLGVCGRCFCWSLLSSIYRFFIVFYGLILDGNSQRAIKPTSHLGEITLNYQIWQDFGLFCFNFKLFCGEMKRTALCFPVLFCRIQCKFY